MTQVRVEQKSYQMPPGDGITIAQFITVADIERSVRFYEKVFGGRILSRGDSKGAPGYIQIANTCCRPRDAWAYWVTPQIRCSRKRCLTRFSSPAALQASKSSQS